MMALSEPAHKAMTAIMTLYLDAKESEPDRIKDDPWIEEKRGKVEAADRNAFATMRDYIYWLDRAQRQFIFHLILGLPESQLTDELYLEFLYVQEGVR